MTNSSSFLSVCPDPPEAELSDVALHWYLLCVCVCVCVGSSSSTGTLSVCSVSLLLVLMATWVFILQETWANATSNKSSVLLYDSNGDAVGLDVWRPVCVCVCVQGDQTWMLASSGNHRAAEVTVRCEKCVYMPAFAHFIHCFLIRGFVLGSIIICPH